MNSARSSSDPEVEAVVLAGGLGSRLGTMAGELSKPMVPINGRPFLEYLLLQLRNHGITKVTLCIGHRGDTIEKYFGGGECLGLDVNYSREMELLGTGGALKLAASLIRSPTLLVLNGDSFCHLDLRQLVRYHVRKHALATIAVSYVADAARFGSVRRARHGEIIGFLEKEQSPGPAYVNAGIYVFDSSLLDLIPANIPISLERDVFPRLIGQRFYSMENPGFFADIGTPASYSALRASPERLLAGIA